MALSNPAFQMALVQRLYDFSEWARLIEVASRPALEKSSDAVWRLLYARKRLGQTEELRKEYDRVVTIFPDKKSDKLGYLREAGDFRAAADYQAELIADRKKQASDSDYDIRNLMNDYYAHGDLLKLAGDEAGARDAYR